MLDIKKITVVHEGGRMPCYMTKGAACADVFCAADFAVWPGTAVKTPLNISFDLPEGWYIKMYPRSSLLIKRQLVSPVSIIDSDYKGIVHVVVGNISCIVTQRIKAGERIAQIELCKVCRCEDWEQLDNERDQNGFGGTGL